MGGTCGQWTDVSLCVNCMYTEGFPCSKCYEHRSKTYTGASMRSRQQSDPSFEDAVRTLEGE